MTYEELNEVRTLKNKIAQATERISALEALIKPAGVKFTRETVINPKTGKEESYTCLDTMPKGRNTNSPTEILAIMLADEKRELAALQQRLADVIPELTKKILEMVNDSTTQALLIYRYISCENFRAIGKRLGYSEQHIYYLHNRIVKKLRVNKS